MEPALIGMGISWVMTAVSVFSIYWQNKKIKVEGESQAVMMAKEAVELYRDVSDVKIKALSEELQACGARAKRIEDMCRTLIFQLQEHEIYPRIHLSQLDD